MKPWIILPFVLLAGLLIGEWGPRSELAAARTELADLKKQLAKASPRTDGLNSVTRMLGVDPKATRAHAGREPNAVTNSAVASVSTNQPVPDIAVTATNAETVSDNKTRHDRHREKNLQEQLDEAYKLWETRSAMARATFLDNLGLTADETAQFDVLMEAMNIRLADSIGRLADDLRADREMTPEKGVRLANEITAAFVQTYDEMDRTMPKTWRENAGNEFKLFDFVDPYVASPLVGVEDKLQGGFMGGM